MITRCSRSGATDEMFIQGAAVSKPPTKQTAVEKGRPPPSFVSMKFTYYGHACFAVEAGGKTLLFDPFITPNPLAKKIDAGKIAADFVLVSHGHGDHLADVIDIAQRTGATLIAPYEVGCWFEGKG